MGTANATPIKKENDEPKSNSDNVDATVIVNNEQMNAVQQELNETNEKYAKQKQEMKSLEDKLCECEQQIQDLKAKNENFVCRLNAQNGSEQCGFLEKGFTKNMNEFSHVLQSEYRASIQAQADEKEENYKQQIEKLNKLLSETKNKLFRVQVKTIKR